MTEKKFRSLLNNNANSSIRVDSGLRLVATVSFDWDGVLECLKCEYGSEHVCKLFMGAAMIDAEEV